MIQKKLKTLVTTIAILLSCSAIAQQLKIPAASPLQTIKQAFALSEITIEYSRPSAKGRLVYGDVVPFGKVWRTGANNSTKITFGEDVKLAGNEVKSGTYALYSVPNKDTWDIMLYKDITLGGNVNDYKIENEVLRIKAIPTTLVNKIETFTIELTNITATSCNLELTWENTQVTVPITTEIDSKIMKTIENTVVKDSRPYFQAASYYYENNKDLNQALEWVSKAVVSNPKAYWILILKAKIQLKLNDKKGAINSANEVLKLATEDKDDAYINQANKLIIQAKQ